MNIGDKVRVVDGGEVYSTYHKMAEIMELKKYHNGANDLRAGDVLTVLNVQTHLRKNEDLLIGCYCKRSNKDFIINIKGVEAVSQEVEQ